MDYSRIPTAPHRRISTHKIKYELLKKRKLSVHIAELVFRLDN